MAIFQKQKKETEQAVTAVISDAADKNEPRSKTVLGSRITEKATSLTTNLRIYSFNVAPKANKYMVKKEIEGMHRVNVTGVRMVNVPRKRRMRGRLEGWKKGYKKALVRVKEGQTIETK